MSQHLSERLDFLPAKTTVTTVFTVNCLLFTTSTSRHHPEMSGHAVFPDKALGQARNARPAWDPTPSGPRLLSPSSASGRPPPQPAPLSWPLPTSGAPARQEGLNSSPEPQGLICMPRPPENPPMLPCSSKALPRARPLPASRPSPAHHDGDGAPPSPPSQALAPRGRPPARRDTESSRAGPRARPLYIPWGAERSRAGQGNGPLRASDSAQAQQIETRN